MSQLHPKIEVFNVVLKALSLSTNPTTKTVDFEKGKDVSNLSGKLNVTSDDRQFYIAEFQQTTMPFTVTKETFMQDKPGNWKMASPEDLIPFIGKQIPGLTVQSVPTELYPILDADGNPKMKKDGTPSMGASFTAVIFGKRNLESLVALEGKTIQGEVPAFNTVAENAEVAQAIEV